MSDQKHLCACLEARKIVEYRIVAGYINNVQEEVNSLISSGFVPCNVGFHRSTYKYYKRDYIQTMCKYESSTVINDLKGDLNTNE